MMPVTKFICDKCGDVKPLSEAKVSHEGGNATYVCADCYSEFE